MLMSLLSWIFLGLFAGSCARPAIRGEDEDGISMALVLGVVGALAGGWLSLQLGWGKPGLFDFHSAAMAISGASLVLLLFRLLMRGGAR